MSNRRGILTALAVAATVVAACTTPGGTQENSAAGTEESSPDGVSASGEDSGIVEGGVLRLGTTQSIDSTNRYTAVEVLSYSMFFQIYPHLVQFDENLEFIGDFATDWIWSEGHDVVTFTVHEGGLWSDGEPVTARDAAYSINLILRYPGPAGQFVADAEAIASVEAPDERTLVINYERPVNEGWALQNLTKISVLPEHVWSEHEVDDGAGLTAFANEAPIVSGGSFILVEFEQDSIAQFVANPDFYGPKPHIDGFGLRFYSNPDAMITALRSGELDAVVDVPPTAFDALVADPDIVAVGSPGLWINQMMINSKAPIHPELLDTRIRHAFAHVIDLEEIKEVVFRGHAELGVGVVPPALGDWHNSDLAPAPYDIDEANRILDEAGYLRGPDGIRLADGRPMVYELTTWQFLEGSVDRMFETIQSGFDQIGVQLTYKSSDLATWVVDIIGEDGVSYDMFDLSMSGWVVDMDPDFGLSLLTCQAVGIHSDSGYCDEEYDRLYQAQASEVDSEARRQLVWDAQEKLFADKPYIMLTYPNILEAHTTEWDGFVMTPQGSFNLMSKLTMLNVHRVSD